MTVGVPAGAVMCTACNARLTADPSQLCNRCRRGAPVAAQVPAQAAAPEPLASVHAAPPPRENQFTLFSLGAPVTGFIVYGEPASQGSKSPKGRDRAGRTILVESSKEVKPWRSAVRDAFLAVRPAGWVPLEGAVVLDLVFTIKRPQAEPKKFRTFPCRQPDVDKLQRSTLDGLGPKGAGLYRDDGQVVGYRRMFEFYTGDPDPDALTSPGAVIRAWVLPREPLA